MKSKIYGTILLLVIVAIGIMGVFIFGITGINTSTLALGSQAKRAVNLTAIDAIALTRSVGMVRLILAATPERRQEIFEDYVQASETRMAAELEDYRKNIPTDADEEMRNRPVRVKTAWDAYVKSTAAVADLAFQDSNRQADALAATMSATWAELSAEIAAICDSIRNDFSPELTAWRDEMRNVRVSIADYRFFLARLNMSDTKEDSEKFAASARGSFEAVITAASHGASLPYGYGEKAKAIVTKVEGLRTKMEEVLRLGLVNSNANALLLLNTDAEEKARALNALTTELVASVRATQDASLVAATATGKRSITVSLTVGVIGILAALILAWRIIASIVGSLQKIIGDLAGGAREVDHASSQLSAASNTLAEGATENAASLEETSAALEELSSMTKSNADNAMEANSLMNQANQAVGQADQSMT
ncbi:MAG: MCP four helix bundle domain-containing protein, partial [Candidatus Adiutrix sp.]|nr:MCP four helix bundle domain-containing protein [Candidatus Adiutrix sp.]